MTLFALLALAAAVIFLALGIGSMVHGGEYDRVHATRYMALRVAAQGAGAAVRRPGDPGLRELKEPRGSAPGGGARCIEIEPSRKSVLFARADGARPVGAVEFLPQVNNPAHRHCRAAQG